MAEEEYVFARGRSNSVDSLKIEWPPTPPNQACAPELPVCSLTVPNCERSNVTTPDTLEDGSTPRSQAFVPGIGPLSLSGKERRLRDIVCAKDAVLTGKAKRLRDIADALGISESTIPFDKPSFTGGEKRCAEIQETNDSRDSASSEEERLVHVDINPGRNSSAPIGVHTSASAKRPRDLDAPVATSPPLLKKVKIAFPEYSDDDDHVSPFVTVESSTITEADEVRMSQEQNHILKLVKRGQSVFYTGSAGTGKSVLLREIIQSLREIFKNAPGAVAVTASTGIAACNIGGVTIHSFAGIGLGVDSKTALVQKVRKQQLARIRWMTTKVLVIDEVSMLDGDLFDKLSHIASELRNDVRPFGGMQLVVTGDFFQLPPVSKGTAKFAFESECWNQAIPRTINLTKVFRQDDQEFIDMLNEMRFGGMSDQTIKKFHSLSRLITYKDGLSPTELFPRREEVDKSNSTRLSDINAEEHSFVAIDDGVADLKHREKLLSNFMAVQNLQLRKGCQVMLIKNIDERLVNGSMGIVVGFVEPTLQILGVSTARKDPVFDTKKTLYPLVKFSLAAHAGDTVTIVVMPESFKTELPSGEVQAMRLQLPLILAWAMSIHKSQGQTLHRVKVDLCKVFEKGQAYVAVSRATSLERLQVLNFDPLKVQAHPTVVKWSRSLETVAEAETL